MGVEKNVFPHLRASDCFLFPSIYEGFGNALAEAISVGTTVITNDCKFGPAEMLGIEGPVKEKIIKEDYIIYPDNQENQLFDSIEYFIKHKNEFRKTNFNDNFRKKFSKEKMKESWNELINV